ncbi:Opacity protein and related surface antigens [Legionella beliardensis]|uniref:Opacity protein and related surface antigens n=1 Tax=Legionella beliardensis TaxID=91822 RepID=A0A378HXM1_9GAMM|nr:outer membrane beta-barrel protein [Legionella beliardensis]STX27678.1 Opacity protein and related surface antigens [Legionella beliardensis]
MKYARKHETKRTIAYLGLFLSLYGQAASSHELGSPKLANGHLESKLNDAKLTNNSYSGWFITAGAGYIKPDINSAIYVANGLSAPSPYNIDKFTIEEKSKTAIIVATGYSWFKEQHWFPSWSLGLRYQHFFKEDIGKRITQYNIPEFENYHYNWEVSNEIISLFAKINLFQYSRFSPYVDGAIGAAWNHGMNYREIAFAHITPRISPAFGSQTTTRFAYSLGAGLDFPLSKQLVTSLSYEFQKLNDVYSNYGQSTWSQEKLKLKDYQVNALFLTLSYVFELTRPIELTK